MSHKEVNALVAPRTNFLATGLELPDNLTFEEWEQAGRSLLQISKSWQWWVGDWINYGEKHYGEKYAQAIEVTGSEEKTLRNAVYVAGQIELSRRRDNLSWSHHAEVASLPPAEQDEWLDRAEEESLTRGKLRVLLQDKRAAETLEEIDDHSGARQ